MTISKYTVFQTIIELGSLTKAAEKLCMTQSGVSHAIASLETEFGFSVLIRDRKGVNLTSNGERILPYIRETIKAEEHLRQQVAAIRGLEAGTVRIGTITSVSSQWLPPIIKQFRLEHPALEVHLLEGDYDEINHWLASGAVDFGFLSLPTASQYEVLPLVKDKMLCILPPGHVLGRQDKISFAQIAAEDFIMPKWGSYGDVRRILQENKVQPKIKYEAAEDQTIIAMVRNGLGISILPEMVLVYGRDQICTVDLAKEAYRTIGIAGLSLKNLSPAAKKFLQDIQSWLACQGLLIE